MKKCFKCNELKSLTSFYKHPQMLDGHVNKCKDCNKRDVRENRFIKVDYYRAYDRARGSRMTLEKQIKWRKENLAKYQTKVLISNLIRSKKLIKQPCEECGVNEYMHAHHEDYLRPFEIKWLCAAHHSQWHKKNGEGKNGKLDLRDYGIVSINQYEPYSNKA